MARLLKPARPAVRHDSRPDHAAGGQLGAADRSSEAAGVAGLILAGLVVAEGVRDGGFWHADALVVAVLSLGALAGQRWLAPLDRRGWAVVSSLVALSAWWLFRAASAHVVTHFLPLGASLLGAAAAFIVIRSQHAAQRAVTAAFVALVGAGVAVSGFVGLVVRWNPLAIPSQHLWRLSSPLTYADAAGLVLGMALLMALGSEIRPWLSRACACLCAGGLLATQSRGALIALVCAAALVPWRRYVLHLVPLVAGALLGALAVATSPWHHAVPALGVALVVLVALSVFWVPGPRRPSRRTVAWWSAIVALVGTAAIVALHHEIWLRVHSPSDRDRSAEWSAAWHQFSSAVLVGVGPDRTLHFHIADGTFAHFAHNEYLQIAAGAGLVGLALLVLSMISLVRVVRRDSVLSSCAVAGLVCLAVGAVFDFDWHLPLIGLLGGGLAGLGAPLPTARAVGSSPRSGSG
jgi:hypothetical protein